jgi:glycosyltransferase involved in cell wall biosynthesis
VVVRWGAVRRDPGGLVRFGRRRAVRVGWVAAGTLDARFPRYSALESAVQMRIANNARWIERLEQSIGCEMYRRGRHYDVVVFFKAMDAVCQAEVDRIRERGGRIVFDANVNYYEIEGDYEIPGTKPTLTQQHDAIAMTRCADHVVADSSFLLGVVRRYAERATWIPDNIDLSRWPGPVVHGERRAVRLVWSGIAKKAAPLLGIVDALAGLRHTELVLVSNERPAVLDTLEQAIPCTYIPFSMRGYPRILDTCDVIISPRKLVNAYELGHTEWKITLGMASGLPAVASPQQSYVEAIGFLGGGVIASSGDEWAAALGSLVEDVRLRAELGARARRTVEQHYDVRLLAQRYVDVLRGLL